MPRGALLSLEGEEGKARFSEAGIRVLPDRQTFAGSLTIGWPGLQAKAAANSGMFTTTPLIRYSCGEWGLMRGAQAQGLGAVAAAGPLREADEEALLGRQAVPRLQLLALRSRPSRPT